MLPSTTFAGPITGPTVAPTTTESEPAQTDSSRRDREREQATAAAFDAGSLFDAIGLPLLRVSAPIYLRLDSQGSSADSGGGGSAPVGPTLPGGPAGDVGNLTVPMNVGGPPPALPGSIAQVPEPGLLLLVAPAALVATRRFRAARRQ